MARILSASSISCLALVWESLFGDEDREHHKIPPLGHDGSHPQHYTYSYGEYERKRNMKRSCIIAGLWGRGMAAFSVIIFGILLVSDCGPGHVAGYRKAATRCQDGHHGSLLLRLHIRHDTAPR